MEYKGLLFIVSGPSGAGKGTVITALRSAFPAFVYPISHTTRAIRPGEKDGETYHYISESEFENGIKNGEFLEWAQVHKKNYYGTLKKTIMDALIAGKIVIREVDVQGFNSIRKVVPAKNLVTIFLKAESLQKLISRIEKRGKLPEEELKRRMESAKNELAAAHLFDYRVLSIDDHVPKCVGQVVDIIKKEADKAGLKI
jgi:guanylate kinase